MTMAYVVVVNLCVLSESSMPLEGVLATCISSAFVTLVMGFWPRRRQDSFSEPFGATLEARITAFCHLAKLLTHLQQETWIAQSVGLRHPRAKKIRPSLVPLKQFTHEPDHRGYLPLSPLAFLLSPDQSGRWLVGAVGIENNNVRNFKDLRGMRRNTKSLKRNNEEWRGILIAPSKLPRLSSVLWSSLPSRHVR